MGRRSVEYRGKNGRTYFIDEYYIQIFKEDQPEKSISSFTKIDCSALIKDTIYIGTPEGVYYLNASDELTYLDVTGSLEGNKIIQILPYKDQLLVITSLNGIYIVGNKEVKKLKSVADDFIDTNQLFCASIVHNKLALGSVQNGIFLFDPEHNNAAETFNLKNGLKNNTALCTFFDKDENLWLGLDKGLAYIDLNNPVRPLFSNESPIGSGYCSALYNNEFYFGTNQGVYKADRRGNYIQVKNGEGQIWSMLEFDNYLFCCGDNGILVITPDKTYKIPVRGAWEVQPLSSDKDKLIAGTYSGFTILKKEKGEWIFSHVISDFYHSTKGFMEDEVPNHFWVTDRGEIHKVEFNKELTEVKNIKKYDTDNLRIKPNTCYQKIENNLFIPAEDGIYTYSRITDNFSHYTQLETLLKGSQYYDYIHVDKYKNIWFVYDKKLYLLEYTRNGYTKPLYTWGMQNLLIEDYINISVVDTGTVIVSIDNGFARLDLNKQTSATPPAAFIRKLNISRTDSTISYNGLSPSPLSFKNNSIHIYFGCTNFTNQDGMIYIYQLKGVDTGWSMPTNRTWKEYTNLQEGTYTFKVKTLSPDGIPCEESAFLTFKVLPPWHRSAGAYLCYITLLFIALFIIYKKTLSKQKKLLVQKKEELELQKIQHATEQKLKDQEIYTLQNENLQKELQYKTQELTGYILNVHQKNEILEELKKNVTSISKAIDEKKDPGVLKQKTTRLISLINSNIEHDKDFEIFKSNFDLIHQDFFKVLGQKYPQLSKNDKVLCAYLKMNLSTKEIAPFLNITVRGVEIMRYRLRKKMNLDREVNLSEFMQNLTP